MLALPAQTLTGLDRVHHCKAEALLAALPTDSIDLIVTSPPYDNLRAYKGFTWDFEYIARESYRVLKPGGVLVWVVRDAFVNGSETLSSMRQAIYFVDYAGFNMHQRVIWQKEGLPAKRPKAYLPDFEDVFVLSKGEPKTFNPIMKKNKKAGQVNRKGHSSKQGFAFVDGYRITPDESILTNVWLINVGLYNTASDNFAYEHPAPYPETLAERVILSWSNPGDIVLDYFGGSGTTAKIARRNNRHYITCDISAEYCDMMRRRLALPYTPNMFEVLAEAVI